MNRVLERQGQTAYYTKAELVDRETIHKYYDSQLEFFASWWNENFFRFENFNFRIKNQSNLFLDTLSKNGFNDAFSTLRLDLYGYYLEYVKQESILPFSLKLKDGKLVGDLYTDKPVTEMVDKEERDGVVYQALIDLEEKLKQLQPGEFIFRVSPAGWTGKNYQYTETQSQLYWQDGDKIRGLTIRTKTAIEDIEKFLGILGICVPKNLDEKEKIKWLTSLNITFSRLNEFITLFSQFFNLSIKDELIISSQILSMIENHNLFRFYDEISDLIDWANVKTKQLADQFLDGRLSEEEFKRYLDFLFGFILMKFTEKELKRDNVHLALENFRQLKEGRLSVSYDTRHPLILNLNYDQIFNHLKSVSGCSGGGNENEGLFGENSWRGLFENSIFGPRGLSNSEKTDKYGSLEFECPHCHQKIKRTEDTLIEKCPKCGGDVKCS